MTKNKVIIVQDQPISIMAVNEQDYISLTDMIKSFGNDTIIYNWMRNRMTIEFLGIWEQIYNPNFNSIEFDKFKKEAGGGTYAHKDIAFEFSSWLSPKFKLYMIREFQRLKDEENKTRSLDWNLQRTLAKINYRIHIDAVKETLLPPVISPQQEGYIYASEADLLNMALFGKTAAEWRKENPGKSGNIRDEATLEQLVVLSNLESINSVFLRQELSQAERLKKLNDIAISQMQSLISNKMLKKLN